MMFWVKSFIFDSKLGDLERNQQLVFSESNKKAESDKVIEVVKK